MKLDDKSLPKHGPTIFPVVLHEARILSRTGNSSNKKNNNWRTIHHMGVTVRGMMKSFAQRQ